MTEEHDEMWIDVSTALSAFEEQIEVRSGRFRHRPWRASETGAAEWVDGPAPKASAA